MCVAAFKQVSLFLESADKTKKKEDWYDQCERGNSRLKDVSLLTA